MNKAFVREDIEPPEEDDDVEVQPLAKGEKNYITPAGFAALQDELRQLLEVERPKVVSIVSWAAGNGDRSENGDYIYGKKRLREIDRRVRFLNRRLSFAEVVDFADRIGCGRIFFGSRVGILGEDGSERYYRIVGVDEADAGKGDISWVSPLARGLLGKRVGDEVEVFLPGGVARFEIIEVEYGPVR